MPVTITMCVRMNVRLPTTDIVYKDNVSVYRVIRGLTVKTELVRLAVTMMR